MANRLFPTEELIEDARAGRMFILIDDEQRENEGDLVIPAEMADAAAINFMARHARGLICLSMTRERVDALGLHLMAPRNGTRHQTAFTVSIEARQGVTTGISAADRARTIAVAIDGSKDRTDIVTPGHVFPLMAQDGGVLVRAGHTEAAVDIASLAGLNPSGVICEIMNDDGTMARLPDLQRFAEAYDLKIGTIADLIAYRSRTERLITLRAEGVIDSRFGGPFAVRVYAAVTNGAEHIALVRGDITERAPALVRVHQANILSDSLGDRTPSEFYGGEIRDRGGELEAAMRMIAEAERGVIVMMKDPQGTSASQSILQRNGVAPRKPIAELRQYGLGAQILRDLGLRDIILLSNANRKIVGLDGYGINVVGQQPIPPHYVHGA